MQAQDKSYKIYVKSPAVETVNDLSQELLHVQDAFEVVSRHLATEVTYVKPDKPVQLQMVYADGSKWNPGQGAGLYIYIGTAWKKITLT